MPNSQQEFEDVVEIEFDAADVKLINLIYERGFLTATDMHAFPVRDPSVRSQIFRVSRELLTYVGFGLDTLSKEVDHPELRQALQQTMKKVWPYIEGLVTGEENLDDEY